MSYQRAVFNCEICYNQSYAKSKNETEAYKAQNEVMKILEDEIKDKETAKDALDVCLSCFHRNYEGDAKYDTFVSEFLCESDFQDRKVIAES